MENLLINLKAGDDMDLWKLKAIFNDKNRFLTLNEIYEEFSERYDVSQYSDFKAAIRTEIYRNCIDRELNTTNKNTFVSFDLKGSRGQKYGLFEWVETIEEGEEDLIFNVKKMPRLYIQKDIHRFVRDENVKRLALKRAHYTCEFDENHITFIKKTDGNNYTEVHHLVPLELQFLDKFKNVNLDCLANTISLCSNCHNQIHYGIDNYSILFKLYNERKGDLYKEGINVSFEELLEFYK